MRERRSDSRQECRFPLISSFSVLHSISRSVLRRDSRVRLSIVGFWLLLATSTAGAASFTIIPPVTVPGDSSPAYGVSADGTRVIGTTPTLGGGANAYVWDSVHGTRLIGSLPGGDQASNGAAVSADGSTIVGVSAPLQSQVEAFIWTAPGGMRGLGGRFSAARAVSGDGSVVVGKSEFSGSKRAFIWDAQGGLRNLGVLPGATSLDAEARGISRDGSLVVGVSASPQTDFGEAFVWSAGTGMQALGDLPGRGFKSAANAISGDGSTIVGLGVSSQGGEATLWDANRTPHGLGDLPGGTFDSEALAVSADGSVVVGRASIIDEFSLPSPSGPDSRSEAFVWDAEHGMRSLKAVLTSLGVDMSDWQLWEATGVSADGQTIVGWGFPGRNQSRLIGFVAVIPEPGVSTLVALGLLVLGCGRWSGLERL